MPGAEEGVVTAEDEGALGWSPLRTAEQRAGSLAGRPNEFEFPADELDGLRLSSRPKVICVIGGGIAGLTAAYELLGPSERHEVVLVDASDRLGGRIQTWHTGGVSGEFGPMRIPPNHLGTLHYVDSFGQETGVFVQSNPNAWCQVGNFKSRRSNFRILIACRHQT
jgi:monoamine oxidase